MTKETRDRKEKYARFQQKMIRRSLRNMRSAKWALQYLLKNGWKPLNDVTNEESDFIHLWYTLDRDGKEFNYMPYGETYISLTLQRSRNDRNKIVGGAKLHTRSLFCTWVHINVFTTVKNTMTLHNLKLEVSRMQKLQSIEV